MIAACLFALTILAAVPGGRPGAVLSRSDSLTGVLARADSAYAAGRDDEARAAYRAALIRDPQSVRANHRLGILLSRIDRLDSALVLVGRARSREPGDAGLLVTEARLLSWAGRLDAAIADYRAVLATDPSQREARLGCARVLGWAGRYDAADSLYAAMLSGVSTDVEARTGRAQNAVWQGRPAIAEAEYLAVVRLDADNVDALMGLARLHHDQGLQRSAAAQVSRVLALDRESRAAIALSREIRAAQRPLLELGFSVGADSDHNVAWSRSFSTSLALADGVRGVFTGGSLVASDPARDASRTLGEIGLQGAYGRGQVTIAAGTRRLDPSAAPGRSAPTGRTSLSYRPFSRLAGGVGFASYPLDETAALIGSGLKADEWQASADADAGRGISLSAEGSGARLSDGNRRASGLLAVMHALGRGCSVGVLGRVLSYERRGVGYFSPDRFVLAEVRGTAAATRRTWSARLNGGLGVQEVGAGAAGQLAWRAAGQLRYGWAVINSVEASLGASNSAATSTTGAFRYLSAALSLRLGL